MAGGMEFAEIFSTVMTAITPITVAIIGYFQVKKNNDDKKYRALRDQNEKLQKDQEKAERDKQTAKIENMQKNMDHIVTEVAELRKDVDIQKIEKQLNQLHSLNEFNFEYIQSLSSVVLIMGDSLASMPGLDSDAKTRLKREIDAHTKKEGAIVNQLYKILV
jgi:hypothetical protein